MVEPNARLLSDQELAELGPPEAIRLPLDLVDANPQNPRRDLAEIDALANNIRTFGLLQPITVRRAGERYELLGGHRRRAAFQLLREQEPHEPQWRTIPAVVRSADDERAFLMLLSSQLHTRNWRPREEAAALERLAVGGLTLKQIGESLSRTESWASKRLRVYADAVLSGYVQSGRLPTTVAEELLPIADADIRRELAERASKQAWSQSAARTEARKLTLETHLRDIARRARELLDLLSSVDARRVPIEATRDLWVLHGRIETMGRGPVLPTVEAAQRAAGVRPKRKR
jgi:ParB/RepB/Spo0J family partition protein